MLTVVLAGGAVVLVQVSWRASASLLVPAGMHVQVCYLLVYLCASASVLLQVTYL